MTRSADWGWRSTRPNVRPRVPDGRRIYAIGDIHGRLDLLEAKLQAIATDEHRRDNLSNTLVFIGDYIDRGSQSKNVIDRLLELSSQMSVVTMLGNHEQMLLDFLRQPLVLLDWIQAGGLTTLLSYGLRPSLQPSPDECADLADQMRQCMGEEHLGFLGSLASSHQIGDYFFAHAGIRPGIPLDQQRKEDLIWIRDEFHRSRLDHSKVIVHGHTPVMRPEIKANRINIDTGAYATGQLTCLVLEGDRRSLL